MLTWAPYLLEFGMVDKDGYTKIMKAANDTKKALDQGQFNEATSLWGYTEGVVLQVTDGVDFYNVMTKIGAGAYKKILQNQGEWGKLKLNYL